MRSMTFYRKGPAMGKQTPKPWIVKPGYEPKIYGHTVNGRIVHIATVHRSQPAHSRHRSQFANAGLIAAAPIMLEALEKILAWTDPHTDTDAMIIRICNDAISAARTSRGYGN